MEKNKQCVQCGGINFTEATDYMPIKPSQLSLKSANKIYTFCLDCGEVTSMGSHQQSPIVGRTPPSA